MKLLGTVRVGTNNAVFDLWEDGQLDVAVEVYDEGGWSTAHCLLRPDETAKLLALLALTAAAKDTPSPTCPTAAAVARKIADRADVGLAKYGTTLAGAGLSRRELLVHAQEEAMDLAVYLQRLIEMEGE